MFIPNNNIRFGLCKLRLRIYFFENYLNLDQYGPTKHLVIIFTPTAEVLTTTVALQPLDIE